MKPVIDVERSSGAGEPGPIMHCDRKKLIGRVLTLQVVDQIYGLPRHSPSPFRNVKPTNRRCARPPLSYFLADLVPDDILHDSG
ncbi:hypothetical protein MTP99_010079 [Tenebrio molitor]|nr:hypothetical protein MTP99_010079 [Tenebrio molitor]